LVRSADRSVYRAYVEVIAGDVSAEELAERLRHWMNKIV